VRGTAHKTGAVLPQPARGPAFAVGLAVVALYAWWATGLRPFSGGAALAVVGAGIVAMAIGQAVLAPVEHRPAQGAIVGWLALLAALAVWQLIAYVSQPRFEHPTLSSLANSVLDSHPARAVAFVAWLVAGAGVARR